MLIRPSILAKEGDCKLIIRKLRVDDRILFRFKKIGDVTFCHVNFAQKFGPPDFQYTGHAIDTNYFFAKASNKEEILVVAEWVAKIAKLKIEEISESGFGITYKLTPRN